jgi:hypothetical protein
MSPIRPHHFSIRFQSIAAVVAAVALSLFGGPGIALAQTLDSQARVDPRSITTRGAHSG